MAILKSWRATQLPSDEGPKKRRLREVDFFLLTHQFVASKRHPERLWRVQKVSGMAMKNSGELSDAAFAFFVERLCLKPDTLSAFAIDLYGRFKDDNHHCCKKRKPHQTLCLVQAQKQMLDSQSGGDLGHICQISGCPSVERWISIRHRP